MVESAFGILAARFRIMKTPIIAHVSRTEDYVLACCILHNYIINEDGSKRYIPHGFADEEGPNGEVILGAYREEVGPNEGKRYI